MELWKGKRLLQLSWQDFGRAADTLFEKVSRDGFVPDAVVALARGGLPLATVMAHRFALHDLRVVSIIRNTSDERYAQRAAPRLQWLAPPKQDWGPGNLLICDDIAGDGATLATTVEELAQIAGLTLRSAALVCNVNCRRRPNFWATESDDWVVFPWENQRHGFEQQEQLVVAAS